MKKLIYMTTALVFFLVFLVPGLVSLSIKFIPAAPQPSLDGTESVYWLHEITQPFICQKDNLTAIAMTIRNLNLTNRKDVILSLYNEDGSLLRTSTLNGQTIEDGTFAKFVFAPVPDSKDKKYTFTLASPTSGEADLLPIFFTRNKPLWVSDMLYNQEAMKGVAVAFVTFHKPQSKWVVVKEVYTSWLAKIF